MIKIALFENLKKWDISVYCLAKTMSGDASINRNNLYRMKRNVDLQTSIKFDTCFRIIEALEKLTGEEKGLDTIIKIERSRDNG